MPEAKEEDSNRLSVIKPEIFEVTVGISNRHVHLSEEDIEQLFGPNYQLTKAKELSQPNQYACEETVMLVGPKGVLEKVRVLGPARKQTQAEITVTDSFKLGIKAPLRDSGDLAGSAPITIVGPKGTVTLKEGAIVAARHIHMHSSDAQQLGLKNGDKVSVRAKGPRGIIFGDVLVRVSDNYKTEMHVDTDEANAVGLRNGDILNAYIHRGHISEILNK
ncbi:phosphate propanoyltransferase [Desulfofalx alkaliphila]|uniref:phosphate propanoyltransferase n=1 Tax=Desulfofalx alkaliphila TaxID=105483 RepID=UPI000A032AC2|nr:phosphate propanoyltransferase [Desulfofalx alkaliphila]